VVVTRRFNVVPGLKRTKKMTADGIVCRGPCLYLGCKRIASTGGTAVIYDNTAASGTVVDEYGAGVVLPPRGVVECINGIYCDLTTDPVMIDYIK
jgi:hypothetical protein